MTKRQQSDQTDDLRDVPDADAERPDAEDVPEEDKHKGATEKDVGDRRGPGAGYDTEPEPVEDKGGVSES